LTNDLNSYSSADESVSSSSPSSDDKESNNGPLGGTWDQWCDFHPAELHLTKLFAEYFTSSSCNQRQQIGLQDSRLDFNAVP
jgi:hypothetical protein